MSPSRGSARSRTTTEGRSLPHCAKRRRLDRATNLKGAGDPRAAREAFARLTAQAFDDSADRHNLSQGFFDPVRALVSVDPYGGNVPYRIEAMPVADRLSFYFRSKCFLTAPPGVPGRRVVSEDIRAEGCAPGPRRRGPRR